MFWKTLIAFDFDEILTQRVAEVTVISRVKILSFTLRLVRCFEFQDMILKTEECRASKNIA